MGVNYKIFQQAAEYTLDPSMVKILTECAAGKFPSNWNFSPPYLTVDSNVYEIPSDVREIPKFIFSLTYQQPVVTWKDIKTCFKDNLLHEFVNAKGIKYQLSSAEKEQLFNLLTLSIATKRLAADDITIRDFKIVSIAHLQWYSKSRRWTVDKPIPKVALKRAAAVKDKTGKLVTSFFKEYEKLFL